MAVYFLHEPIAGAVKIGHSRSVVERQDDIQCGNPAELILLGTVPGGRREEKRLHGRFAAYHVRREWFLAPPEVLGFLVEAARQPEAVSDTLATEDWSLAMQAARVAEGAYRRGFQHGHLAGTGGGAFGAVSPEDVADWRFFTAPDESLAPPGSPTTGMRTPAVQRLAWECGNDEAVGVLSRLARSAVRFQKGKKKQQDS